MSSREESFVVGQEPLFQVYQIEGSGKKVISLNSFDYNYPADEDIKSLIKKYGYVIFDENYNGHFDWLPDGVIDIRINSNPMMHLLSNLPSTTKSITITRNFNSPIDKLPFIEYLAITPYNYNFNQTPEHLPPTCKKVIIHSKAFNFPLDAFPDTVEELVLNMFDIGNTTKIPANLKTLDITKSFYSIKTIKAFQLKFPNLTIIYIERMITSRQQEYFRLTGIKPGNWPIDVEIK